jgi:hypothetical protein
MITSHASVNAVQSGPSDGRSNNEGAFAGSASSLKLGRAAMRLREIGVSTALASAAVAALIFVNGGV